MSPPEDIPPGVDFLPEDAAKKWAEEAEAKLGSRINFFAAFVRVLCPQSESIANVEVDAEKQPGITSADYLAAYAEGTARALPPPL